MKKLYYYVALSDKDYAFFRLGGPGLANCMFFVARAAILAKQNRGVLLRPTWERFGIGPLIRREKDARFYCGLFKREGVWSALKRLFLIRFARRVSEHSENVPPCGLVVVSGWVGFNKKLVQYYEDVKRYFDAVINPKAIANVPSSLDGVVAVHVRLGDFPVEWRTDIHWYAEKMLQVSEASSKKLSFQIFSDGRDEELSEILAVPGASRAFYGNALADMMAISRCQVLIGSGSTFSWWGGIFRSGALHILEGIQ